MQQAMRKMSIVVFIFTVTVLSAAMLYQTIESTIKWNSSPTGTNVDYKRANSDLKLSLTFCKIKGFDLDPIFRKVFSRNNDQAPWKIYYDSSNSEKTDIFIWQKTRIDLLNCRTIPFKGSEIKIYHRMNPNSADSIFLHDSGSLTGQSTLEISKHLIRDSNIIQLDAKQIELIQDINNCTSCLNFDMCRNKHIYQEMNATFGCVLYPR